MRGRSPGLINSQATASSSGRRRNGVDRAPAGSTPVLDRPNTYCSASGRVSDQGLPLTFLHVEGEFLSAERREQPATSALLGQNLHAGDGAPGTPRRNQERSLRPERGEGNVLPRCRNRREEQHHAAVALQQHLLHARSGGEEIGRASCRERGEVEEV